jgi:hypothetical protein
MRGCYGLALFHNLGSNISFFPRGTRSYATAVREPAPAHGHAVEAGCYGGQSRGCIWTLRHPHLIQPYLAYYDHLASHYGGPWCPPYTGGAIRSI